MGELLTFISTANLITVIFVVGTLMFLIAAIKLEGKIEVAPIMRIILALFGLSLMGLSIAGGLMAKPTVNAPTVVNIENTPSSLPAPIGTLKIVSSFPMTGEEFAHVQPIINAIKLRFEQSNYSVCGDKYKIEYETWDDASAALGRWDSAVETNNAYKAVADSSIVAYIGTWNSGAAKLSIPILNPASLIMISPGNTYAGLTKSGSGEADEPDKYYPTGVRNYARVSIADDVQGDATARFVQGYLNARTVYILDDGTAYGKAVADVFSKTSDRIGLTVLGHESIDPQAPNYSSVVLSRIATSNNGSPPDAIYAGMVSDSNAVQLLKDKVAIMGSNNKVKFIGPDGIYDQSIIDSSGAGEAENVYVSSSSPLIDQLPQAGLIFKSAYEVKYGLLTEPYAINGYEAASIVLKAIEDVCASGGIPTNRESIRAAVFAIRNFNGVLGNWSFDTNGDISLTNTAFYVITNGAFEFVTIYK